MLLRLPIVTVIISISVLTTFTEGCSEPVGWKAKSLSYRAEKTPNIIYGQCTNVYQGEQRRTYEFDIYCVLKGGPFPRMQLINITDNEFDCTISGVEKGMQYILFVEILSNENAFPNKYEVDEVNTQTAALMPTENNFQIISRAARDLNDTDCSGGVTGGTVEVPCFNTDIDDKVCSGGVTTKSVINFAVVLLLLIIAFTKN